MSTGTIRNLQSEQFAEEARFKQGQDTRRKQHQDTVSSTQAEQQNEVDKLIAYQQKQLTELKKAFDVEFSREAKTQEEALKAQHETNEKQLAERKKSYEANFEKLAQRERTRVEQYKKNQEEQLQKLHEKYQAAQEDMTSRNSG
jgi:hypothetical protein